MLIIDFDQAAKIGRFPIDENLFLYQGRPIGRNAQGRFGQASVTAVTIWEKSSKKNLLSGETGLH
jgi:hypothetical protein